MRNPFSVTTAHAAAAALATLLTGQSISPAAAASPSFSCTGNLLPAEAVICSDDSLAALDLSLAAAYQKMYDSFPASDRHELVDVQKEWIARRNACGPDKTCIRDAYTSRLAQFPSAPPQPAVPQTSVISVRSATYGGNCGVPIGNQTFVLQDSCNGRSACNYTINYQVIGDPRPGCRKSYVASWTCSGRAEEKSITVPGEAGVGSQITLSCP
jgi:uncharacterized protein